MGFKSIICTPCKMKKIWFLILRHRAIPGVKCTYSIFQDLTIGLGYLEVE